MHCSRSLSCHGPREIEERVFHLQCLDCRDNATVRELLGQAQGRSLLQQSVRDPTADDGQNHWLDDSL